MRILIVDDDPEELELFQAASESIDGNIQFSLALDCPEALHQIGQSLPDLVILDVNLGPHSGIDCLRTLRSVDGLPVIMYSTSGSIHHIDRCFEEKADYFFVKPFSIPEIKGILQKLVSIDWKQNKFVDRERFVISG